MRIFFKKIFLLTLFISLFFYAQSQESKQGILTVTGYVRNAENSNTFIKKAKYLIYMNQKLIDSTYTGVSGRYILNLKLNNNYLLVFSKEGFVSKKILIDTHVPACEASKNFSLKNLLIDLNKSSDENDLIAATLPVLKYSYSIKKGNFIPEKVTGTQNEVNILLKHINQLKKEINDYKDITAKQDLQIKELQITQNLGIKYEEEAQKKADSIIAAARIRAQLILEASKKDSAEKASSIEKATQNITETDFENLNVDKQEFKKKQEVIQYQKKIEELSKRQNKTAADSLNIKENKLGLKKEFLELAKAKLENDRLKAKTHEDSLKIQQREAELFLIEQNMKLAAQEIESAKKELALKELEIKQKNIIIYGTTAGLIILAGLLFIIFNLYRQKKKMNLVLEKQNIKLEEQNKQIKAQNLQILKSIDSGKRIQAAILPSNKLLLHFFPHSFVFFRPRDIVSGDFYWFSVQNNQLFIAAVDCTGHGVPGAFMSLIGNTLLNHIVNEKGIYTPSEILQELHLGVRAALSQSKSDENDDRSDGMDISLCRFDIEKKEITLALANHTAIILKKGEITEIEGDEFGIADELIGDEKPEFTNHNFPMDKEASLYMFSDGFPDQFGGPKNKKFYISNLKKLFIENENLSMQQQYEKINERFNEWKGSGRQYDDVLVMGFKLDL